MFQVIVQTKPGKQERYRIEDTVCTIGSSKHNNVYIKSRKVAKVHAVIELDNAGLRIDDQGSMSGTWINRERVVSFGPLTEEDEIVIGEYRLWVRELGTAIKAKPETGNQVNLNSTKAASVTPLATPQAQLSSAEVANKDLLLEWRRHVHDRILEQMDIRRKDLHSMSDDQVRIETEALIDEILSALDNQIPKELDRAALRKDVLNEAIGLGPLEKLLEDDDVTEIMVNSSSQIFVEKKGNLTLSDSIFTSDHAVLSVIERIIAPLGRRIDESSPMVDARLKDGSRVNAIIPPLALKGPCITIRKFAKERLHAKDLVNFGSISPQMVEFLELCIVKKRNVVVSGGTGSGKTTLLNVLSNFIPSEERIVTAEDAAELQLNQPNLVSLESRPPNLEGKGQIAIRDLVKNALRMRPDRIVVGECRGGEALDMLQAMNTGHDGSLTTAHANSPRDILSRLEVMVMMSGMDLPITAIREQIASAVNLIVQQTRFPCGSRKVTYVTEVVGMESGVIQLQDIFRYRQDGVDDNGKVVGDFEACGFIPQFYEDLKKIGVDVDLSIFSKNSHEAA